MPRFRITWSKAYYRNGETIIDAPDAASAMDIVDEKIGDWAGSLQYCPDDNQVDLSEIDPDEQ